MLAETRRVTGQVRGLPGGIRPAENPISMGKAPEAHHDVVVGDCESRETRQGVPQARGRDPLELGKQRDAAPLVLERLRVFQRQVEEGALEGRQLAVLPQFETRDAQAARLGIQ